MDERELIKGKMPDAVRPLVFLDFDGVVNLFRRDGRDDVVRKTIFVPGGSDAFLNADREVEIAYRQEVADTLRPLNCLWITNWKARTQDVLNPVLGFDFGYVDWLYRGLSDSGCYGKKLGIERASAMLGLSEYAVADDVFYGWEDAFPPGVLLIAPDPEEGLSDAELAKILGFAG